MLLLVANTNNYITGQHHTDGVTKFELRISRKQSYYAMLSHQSLSHLKPEAS